MAAFLTVTAAVGGTIARGMATEDRPLRYGWTTGACATAAAKAAYQALLTGEFPDPVEVTLPRGQHPAFALATTSLGDGAATAGVVKDAGDDPDVTHGALILATVRRAARGSGVSFRAGEGVGTVTRPGLPIPPGEPAINPVPRQMLREAIAEIAAAHGDAGDVEIEIAIPGGEALAAKTLNGRLGIVGGLSILGTTGIVVPYSCSAWIHSIHSGIDVARAAGLDAYRRRDRLGLRGRRAEAARPSRNRADRHGRFRRRHAEISAHASRAARHHRRRRRQDDQARPRPARPAFAARLGRSRRARRARASRPAARPSLARASSPPTPRRKPSPMPKRKACALGRCGRARRMGNRCRCRCRQAASRSRLRCSTATAGSSATRRSRRLTPRLP